MYNPQLDTFLRMADAGSFNKAAEDAYITPTAVIKQINLLEARIQNTLSSIMRIP
jgi:DNA-binding transcriptional LysR family regulator